ncbi:alpha-ketoglutarate-dependent dioxygenase AlkB [Tuwongella immobilis]|uniref:Fe2OG dioxygenase domain-containing protein n=1 Tax=Tuwongella immobilis TaxID=692036 RepID=A0A6C2YII4_9BACT|nr:alpha-ketoglutarate-dependent dioxygenase AlkB [Tuwongella immobilis]VIP00802.1 dna repair protein : 2OG-Fe(II) oxygenase OS=Cyanothece sp. (strain PCC 7425 / ATCC 29141) GN=Cyan7425_5365 PE=4 SV=1: 2OG-FeII_Oxy_2 [Tuwongella immobilis]VTR97022.1 dna repair protein : 2OG-Fe(II) oxygenase OS=Cyanothece sp. (strain PCC 7425 / ATCC 29141) GN=Cyan7425_5365 PE=4 SV=1: 2OG-FeII_Oxy_2 [Tuwongella immobilis]
MATDPNEPLEGMTYFRDFVNESDEITLLNTIDRQPWCADMRRRVQHYGYRYEYKSRATRPDAYLGPLPTWLEEWTRLLLQGKHFPVAPDQAIVNEYSPGQGIAPHVDCVSCFSDTVASLSLGSSCVMSFKNIVTSQERPWFIERRSLLVLTGKARFDWKHAIAPRRSDLVNGQRVLRGRRVSLTFRKMI